MEILISEAFAKINPTDLLILGKQEARRKRKLRVPPVRRYLEPKFHGVHAGTVNEEIRHN